MLYSDYVIEEIRTANDIVSVVSQYTSLVQRGGNYFGLCPFHREKSPSFSVSPQKQLYHCFGCGASGNVVTFIMQKENYDFRETIVYLAERVGYKLPEPAQNDDYRVQQELKNSLYEIHTKSARYFYELLNSEQGEAARGYLRQRGVSRRMLVKFGLGYSGDDSGGLYNMLVSRGYSEDQILKSGLVLPSKKGGYYDRFRGRLMFPIFDVYGKVIAFGGRIIDKGEPKYLNSPETPIFSKSKSLYGLNFARQAGTKDFILVEGYMDVIALHQYGFQNACASLGTAFNNDHAVLLKKYCENATLLFDSDDAGEKAALRAISTLSASGIGIRLLQLQDAKDPDEFLKRFGGERFADAIGSSESHIVFQLRTMRKKYNLNEPAEKVKYTNEASALLARLPNSIEREVYIKELSGLSGISGEAIKSEVLKQSDSVLNEIRDFSYINKPMIYSPDKLERKTDEARRALLAFIASDVHLARELRGIVKGEELVIGVYERLYTLIYKCFDSEHTVSPAALIDSFETLDDQRTASLVFASMPEIYEMENLRDAVNEWIGIIKQAYVKHCIDKLKHEPEKQENWDEKLNNLAESLRKLNVLVYNDHRWLQ